MPTVSVNTHFPGYEILGELGRSNARVLKARHVATGDLVAIKHFTLGTDADTLRRFQQESAIMTSIRHPNVVKVREVQLDMPLPFIVMEWVEGGDLRSLIRQGALDVPTVLRLGQQMASAFKAIHPEGILHRDIKPENILYRPLASGELHFLLTDFGVARLREQSQTLTGQSLLTYEYASPEQFDNPRGVGVATDYYSLGVVLYECLTGRVPFAMTDTAGIATFMTQVLRTPPPALLLPSGQPLPPSLNTLVNWMLVKDPAERLSDVSELTVLLGQASVEQLQAGRAGTRPAPAVPRAQTMAAPVAGSQTPGYAEPATEDEPPRRSSGTGGWIAFIVAVGLLIGFGMYYLKQRKPAQSAARSTPTVVEDTLDTTAADTMAAPYDTYSDETTPTDSTEQPSESVVSPDTTAAPARDSTAVADSTSTEN
ncbi:serine/threonine protein kinase [Fibrisoma montanum]|uniref:non-specific serine/threonine protein kinase n=1 Tax=Fibrisoma montanum TaxID=2305895 RepID=A0A418M8X3_9BACT|nr:serine/threonine-protein kinase [Fibrisoma montanum]RIV22545.1 serine/threonine protein kinase [Fibrisoma montanum]